MVGNGSPEQAADFVETTKFPSTLYTDPSRASYRGFGLERGVGRTLGPASLVRGTVAFFSGHRQTALAGDPWQQGGTFVISPAAIANSRCLTLPRPLTWPTMGTL